MKYIALILLFFTTTKAYHRSNEGALIIEVDNIQVPSGIIWVGIYNSEDNFLIKEKAIIEGFKVNKTGKKTITFDPLKYGKYAVALFHDINGNGELDKNWIGIPTEPYAFSKKTRNKWRVPRFNEIQFDFSQPSVHISTHLNRWSD